VSASTEGAGLAARHALGWLLFGCTVGLWMALGLVAPRLGDTLAPWTYGRWAPVHLNSLLYGWSALPWVGLLLRAYAAPLSGWLGARTAVTAWSATLAYGCARWLSGDTSGKLFMDWRGESRLLFPAALLLLSGTLLRGLIGGWRNWDRRGRFFRSALWLVLAPVGPLLGWAADPSLYPPVNPDSGGPTGVSLLGSTLALIGILLATPALLGLPQAPGACRRTRRLAVGLALHLAVLAALPWGEASHHDPLQIAAMASLLPWPIWLLRIGRGVQWPEGARPWLLAFAGWGAFLTASACLLFLPGWLERAKFTNLLVGHAHAAMAGMLSAYLAVILLALSPDARGLGSPGAFWAWQAGSVLHVLATKGAGGLEAFHPGIAFSASTAFSTLYVLRLLSGVLLTGAAVHWWRRASAPPGLESSPCPNP
jgi:cytochrome c oxidase cbb3-type subunit 1